MENVQNETKTDNRLPITLTAEEVYEKLRVISREKKDAEDESGKDREWARIAYSDQATAFTAPLEFAQQLEDYDIYSVTLRPNTFQRPVVERDDDGNIQETDRTETVYNYVYGNHMTLDGKEKLDEKLDKILIIKERSEDRKMERELKLASAKLAPMTNEPALTN